MRTYVKRVRAAIEAKDGKVAELLKAAVAGHRQGRAKGVIDKKAASRKISRLTKSLIRANA